MWYRVWHRCYGSGMSGPEQRCWPDGKSLLEQFSLTVNVFDLIDHQVELEAKVEKLKQEALAKNGQRS